MKSHGQEVLMRAAPPRGLDRRGFLQRTGTITAGGLAALAKPSGGASPAANAVGAPPVLMPGARLGEPYFFRLETMAGRTAVGPAVKEV